MSKQCIWNMGDDCGTGVALPKSFHREKNCMASTRHAQGRRSSRIRTSSHIFFGTGYAHSVSAVCQHQPVTGKHYRQDIEFTVERGNSTYSRPETEKEYAAAIKIAVDMVHEGLITKEEAMLRVDKQINQVLHPRIDTTVKLDVIATGLPASPGRLPEVWF